MDRVHLSPESNSPAGEYMYFVNLKCYAGSKNEVIQNKFRVGLLPTDILNPKTEGYSQELKMSWKSHGRSFFCFKKFTRFPWHFFLISANILKLWTLWTGKYQWGQKTSGRFFAH